ncbi:MAG: hypothetical protein C0613_00835 [Desulfobulbaceae bacterium]|nr:MAG: hypothetical protein C0613_00835 [Desulfobulbaceae bacterium]
MKITSGLNRQIFLAMTFVGLFPLLIMAFQNHIFARNSIENVEKEHLSFSLRSRLLWLRTWVSHTRQDFYHLAFTGSGRQGGSEQERYLLAARKLFKGHIIYRSISLYRSDWSLLVRYPEGVKGAVQMPQGQYRRALEAPGGLFQLGGEYRHDNGDVILPVGQALLNKQGEVGAFLVAEVNLSRSLDRILGDTSDLNEGGRYILVSRQGKILYRSSLADQTEPVQECAGNRVPTSLLDSPAWQVRRMLNCEGDEVYSIHAPIDEFDWLLISQFPTGGALNQFQSFILYGLVTVFVTVLIVVVLAKNLSSRLTAPLDELARVARRITAGQHSQRLPPFKEEYVQEVGEAFNTMMDTLEQQQRSMLQSTALSTVGRMSSSIVHEMRNPLSSIKINLQALARKVAGDEAYGEMADISLVQVGRLEQMFDDLLQFSKPLDIRKKKITFCQLVDEVLTTLQSEAAAKDIVLRVEDNLGNALFRADRAHSCRALANLVGNAIQWSPVASEVIIAGQRPRDGTGAVLISVTDHGPGLTVEQMEKVFHPFFTTRELGTGLGLANVKKVMDYQGGAVFAGNNPEGGAVFSLLFQD